MEDKIKTAFKSGLKAKIDHAKHDRDLDQAAAWSAIHDLDDANQEKLAAAIGGLSDADVETIKEGHEKRMNAAAGGGALATLFETVASVVTDPAKQKAVLAFISSIVDFYHQLKPSEPTPAPAASVEKTDAATGDADATA